MFDSESEIRSLLDPEMDSENVEQVERDKRNEENVEMESKKFQITRREKLIITFTIYFCNFAMGIAFNFLGPAVIDFSNKYETDVPTVSIVFTVLTVCYLTGALTAGLVYRYVPRQIALIFYSSLLAGCMFAIPHLSTLTLFYVFNGILGIGVGGFETGEVTWIIDIWRGEAAVWILAQHFFYSLGTIVPALLLSPFLQGKEPDENMTTTTTTMSSIILSSSSSAPEEPFVSKLGTPYTVAGSIVALGISMQILLLFRLRGKVSTTTLQNTPINTSEDDLEHSIPVPSSSAPASSIDVNRHRGDIWRTVFLVTLSCLTLGFYSGMEITSISFMPTFSVFSDLKLSEAEGARVLSGLTISYAAARFAGIFLGMRVRPEYILVGNYVLIISANIILLVVGQTNLTMLWVGSCLLGAGLSTVYPAFYGFIEEHLYITDTIASVNVVAGGLVSSIYPLIVGSSVEKNPSILIYVNFFSIGFFTITFSIVFWYTRLRRVKQNQN